MFETKGTLGDLSSDAPPPRRSVGRIARTRFDLSRFGGLYIIALLGLYFWFSEQQFRTAANIRLLAGSQAIVGILTLGLIVSLISGVFDLSIAANMSFSLSFVGWLQATAHLNGALAVIVTLLGGAAIGCVNAVIITIVRVDAIIGTLGMSAILSAAAYMLVNGQDVILSGISPGFIKVATVRFLSMPITVFYFFGIALILWYALERTPWGRYLRAAGSNAAATKLAGVKVVRLQWSALVVSGTLGALAGVLLTMQLGSASFAAGDSYLLPAFAAAFLGTTQIQPGRFNVWGTVVALYLLAIAVKGLQLRYPSTPWIASFISGAVLIVSVGILARTRGSRRA